MPYGTAMRSLITAVSVLASMVASVLVLALLAACSAPPAPAPPKVPVLVRVWLTRDARPEQQQAIRGKLEAMPGVRTVVFRTAQEAYEQAKKEFANEPDLLRILRPEAFTGNFELTVDDKATVDRVTNAMHGVPGVRWVSAPSPPSPPAAPPTR